MYRSHTKFCGTNSDGHQVFVVCLYGHTYTVWTNEQLDILFTECINRWRKTPANLLDWNTFEKLSQLIDEYRELQPVLYVTQFERGVQTLWTVEGPRSLRRFADVNTLKHLPPNWETLKWYSLSQNPCLAGCDVFTAIDDAAKKVYIVFDGFCDEADGIYRDDVAELELIRSVCLL